VTAGRAAALAAWITAIGVSRALRRARGAPAVRVGARRERGRRARAAGREPIRLAGAARSDRRGRRRVRRREPEALAVAEQRIAEVPGVRAVIGPAGLLDITVDARGHTSARAVLARGRGKMVTGAGEPSESEGEAARQRVVRRSDALGWFLTENGRRVRFFVDTESWPRVAPGVATALAASGLGLAPTSSAELEAHPLWPDPGGPGDSCPSASRRLWSLFALVAVRRARIVVAGRRGWRRLGPALAAAAGAAAPFALVP
jgi:hypothetical protein